MVFWHQFCIWNHARQFYITLTMIYGLGLLTSHAATTPKPDIIYRSARVAVGSHVTLFGFVNQKTPNHNGAVAYWRKDNKVITRTKKRKYIFLDRGYTLLIRGFNSKDAGIYAFYYHSGSSHIVTYFNMEADESKNQNLSVNSIAGTTVGLILVFMVVFVVVFYCCRVGRSPVQPTTVSRHYFPDKKYGMENKTKDVAERKQFSDEDDIRSCLCCHKAFLRSTPSDASNIGTITGVNNNYTPISNQSGTTADEPCQSYASWSAERKSLGTTV